MSNSHSNDTDNDLSADEIKAEAAKKAVESLKAECERYRKYLEAKIDFKRVRKNINKYYLKKSNVLTADQKANLDHKDLGLLSILPEKNLSKESKEKFVDVAGDFFFRGRRDLSNALWM